MYTYKYPRPALTVDALVFHKNDKGQLSILLIQRKNEPFKNMWAFPGGFMDMQETLEQAVERELFEETEIKDVKLKQLRAYSAIDRDPRGRTISVAFYGFLHEMIQPHGSDDARKAAWFNIKSLPHLAFDHEVILHNALNLIQ
jgi:8-oxo-dGTP diphosphatase